jgi:putative transposase
MARPTSINIVRHISNDELEDMIRAARKEMNGYARSKKVYDRLLFVKMRYSGRSAEEAAAAVGFSRATGYNTQELWNSKGPGHLLPVPNPGRPSRMTQDQKGRLRNILSMSPMETNDVRLYIIEEFNITYSIKQVHVILSKMGLHHSKPYPKDHRRPDDAEDILKKDSKMLWTVSPMTSL